MAGAFQHLEPVVAHDVLSRLLRSAPPKGRILVAPQEHSRRRYGPDLGERLPGGTARQVGTVVVERCREAARPAQRAGEVVDHALRHRFRVGTDSEHMPEPPVIVVLQHVLGLALLDEQRNVARARLLVLIVAARGPGGGPRRRRTNSRRLRSLSLPASPKPYHHPPPPPPRAPKGRSPARP